MSGRSMTCVYSMNSNMPGEVTWEFYIFFSHEIRVCDKIRFCQFEVFYKHFNSTDTVTVSQYD